MCCSITSVYLSVTARKYKLARRPYALALVLLFVAGVGLARMLNIWHNTITVTEYQHHMQHINEPTYLHNRGQVPE